MFQPSQILEPFVSELAVRSQGQIFKSLDLSDVFQNFISETAVSHAQVSEWWQFGKIFIATRRNSVIVDRKGAQALRGSEGMQARALMLVRSMLR